jgi:uncharacterized protein DUF4349
MRSRSPVVDQRIVVLLRHATPSAPDALRLRVASLATAAPAPRLHLLARRPRRRVLLALLLACLVAATVGAALLRGVVTAVSPERAAAPTRAARRVPHSLEANAFGPVTTAGQPALRPSIAIPAIPPSSTRVQDYRASLRLRVKDADDLSDRTKEVLRLTRGFGGYVVSVRYGVGREGDATLDLRVPVQRVQEALVRFSALGTIIEQRVAIRDLQGRIDEQARRLDKLGARIASLRRALADEGLPADEHAHLEAELKRARAARAVLRETRARLLRTGTFARVSLGLTTRRPTAVGGDEPGRIERTLGDAGSLLSREAAVAIYALIVAGPVVLLLALAWAAVREGRRRARERVLERA